MGATRKCGIIVSSALISIRAPARGATAEDTVVNPSIMNVTTGETLKLLCTMLPDDEIVITTEQGNIDVVLRRNGKEYDYNYTVDEDNEGYVQLETGRNYINYTADSGGDYMNVNFDFENRYVMP